MVEETDVRIGNLVWYYDYNMMETVFRVEGILEGYVYNSGLPKSKLPLSKVHPVTLETDHLEKFGFLPGDAEYGEDVHTYSFKYNHKDSIYIRDTGTSFQPMARSANGFVAYGRPIVHLHQLQNLFYDLTREEGFVVG